MKKYSFIYVRELEVHPSPRWCARLFRIPFFVEVNDLLVPFFLKEGIKAARVNTVEHHQKSDLYQAAGVIVPSVPMRCWLLEKYQLPPCRVHFLPNGAESNDGRSCRPEEARKRLGMPPDCFCLGFVGNIYDRYDFDTLLEACRLCVSRVPDLFLLFIGDGPLKGELIRKTTELGMEKKVLFTGYLPSDSLGRYLSAIDVGLCLGGLYFTELYGPISTKIATCGIHRVPAIVAATSLDGYPAGLMESLFVVPPEDAVALAELIVRLRANQEELDARAAALHRFVKSDMTWDAVAAKILRLACRDVTGRQEQMTARPCSLSARGETEIE